jgi:hypothetical protein
MVSLDLNVRASVFEDSPLKRDEAADGVEGWFWYLIYYWSGGFTAGVFTQ